MWPVRLQLDLGAEKISGVHMASNSLLGGARTLSRGTEVHTWFCQVRGNVIVAHL